MGSNDPKTLSSLHTQKKMVISYYTDGFASLQEIQYIGSLNEVDLAEIRTVFWVSGGVFFQIYLLKVLVAIATRKSNMVHINGAYREGQKERAATMT